MKATKYRYTNNSEQTLTLFGVGEVKPGETVDTTFIVENPNFGIEVIHPGKKANEDKK